MYPMLYVDPPTRFTDSQMKFYLFDKHTVAFIHCSSEYISCSDGSFVIFIRTSNANKLIVLIHQFYGKLHFARGRQCLLSNFVWI